MNNEYEKFYARLRKVGDSIILTVPANIVKFAGFGEDVEVKVMIKRNDEEE